MFIISSFDTEDKVFMDDYVSKIMNEEPTLTKLAAVLPKEEVNTLFKNTFGFLMKFLYASVWQVWSHKLITIILFN